MSPVSRRDRVSGADHLRDVMDRAADEDASLPVIEADRGCEDRIEDHRDRRQRGDADDREDGVALAVRVRGNTEAMASAADAPQIATAPPESTPNTGTGPGGAQAGNRTRLSSRRRPSRSRPAKRRGEDLAQRDAHAEQGDAEPQHRSRGELDARDAAAFLMEKMEGHAEQQREQHDRRACNAATATSRPARSCRDQQARIDSVNELGAGPRGETRRRRAALDGDQAFHAVVGFRSRCPAVWRYSNW